MHKLEMIPGKSISKPKVQPIQSTSSYWQRAPAGGLLRTFKTIGDEVEKDSLLGMIADPFGEAETGITADHAGLIIGRTNPPIVNEGDGLFHIAKVSRSADPESTIDSLTTQLEADPLFDEDEII